MRTLLVQVANGLSRLGATSSYRAYRSVHIGLPDAGYPGWQNRTESATATMLPEQMRKFPSTAAGKHAEQDIEIHPQASRHLGPEADQCLATSLEAGPSDGDSGGDEFLLVDGSLRIETSREGPQCKHDRPGCDSGLGSASRSRGRQSFGLQQFKATRYEDLVSRTRPLMTFDSVVTSSREKMKPARAICLRHGFGGAGGGGGRASFRKAEAPEDGSNYLLVHEHPMS